MTHSTHPAPTFGQWLKRLRAQQDLTQEALAELAYCSVQTIRFFETGKRRPSLEMAERLAQVLGVPAAQQAEFVRLARQAIEKQALAATAETDVAVSEPPVPKPTLPHVTTALVGREGECNVLLRLLRDDQQRLVTLVGPGGMGKTRLALETATALAAHFADGAAFVALAPLQSAAQLPEAVADVLGIVLKGGADPEEQVLAWLATRHLLLVLDNFEHLLEDSTASAPLRAGAPSNNNAPLRAGAPTNNNAPLRAGAPSNNNAIVWIKALLLRAPKLQVLITSRERLRVSGERIFELGGLSLPGPTVAPEAAEAVKLFVERAQHVTGDFTLDERNKAPIARICHLVNGMPLGIELAAAWVRVLTCDEIAEEMVRSLDFLVRADRDVALRHHSMRAVFDSSWRLLAPDEQQVAARLAARQL